MSTKPYVKPTAELIPAEPFEFYDLCDRIDYVKKEATPMTKTIWIARVADDNSDAYRAYFDEDSARKQADQYACHLTNKEKLTHAVTVESYTVETDDDTLSAEALYKALLDGSDEGVDPDTCEIVG